MQHVYGFFIEMDPEQDTPVLCTLRRSNAEMPISEHWVMPRFCGNVSLGGIPAVAPVTPTGTEITLEVSHPERVLRSHLLTGS